jgi:hypothetical protein
MKTIATSLQTALVITRLILNNNGPLVKYLDSHRLCHDLRDLYPEGFDVSHAFFDYRATYIRTYPDGGDLGVRGVLVNALRRDLVSLSWDVEIHLGMTQRTCTKLYLVGESEGSKFRALDELMNSYPSELSLRGLL